MKKKILAIILALLMAFAFVGCSGGGSSDEPKVIEAPFQDADWGQTVYPVGNTATIGDFELTFTDAFTKNEIDNGATFFAPDDGKTFIVAKFKVTNHGTKPASLIEMYRPEGLSCSLMPVGTDDEFAPGALMGYTYDLCGKEIQPNETVENGVLVFEVPNSTFTDAVKYFDIAFYFASLSPLTETSDEVLVFRTD